MTQPAIAIRNLGKEYVIGAEQHPRTFREMLTGLATRPFRRETDGAERFWALRDVEFDIQTGEVVGIIGRNGAGKSTLLKILARITDPTCGTATIRGRVASLLEVGTGFHPELSGRENILLNGAILGMTRREIQARFDEIVAFAEVDKFIDTPVKRYSSGMYVRLAFAVAAHLEPEILLVDEVLAVGDARFQKKCLGQMEASAKAGRTVLLVSHNMDSVRKLCSRAVSLKDGRVSGDGAAARVIDDYIAETEGRLQSHVIDLRPDLAAPFRIEKIEILDAQLQPLRQPVTWQPASFRITYTSEQLLPRGCVVFQLSTLSGTPLIVCTTRPDRTIDAPFSPGRHSLVCRFPRFPLAAGRYLVGAALAVPFEAYMSNALDAEVLEVGTSDVYGSGLAPGNDRYAVATEYDWEIVS
jgi:lipopolysaccharide transport system ATP-binding protein